MQNFNDINEWTPKKLRTLRNNLNNRLSSFTADGDKVKELQKSNKLYAMDESACKELLEKVQKLLTQAKKS